MGAGGSVASKELSEGVRRHCASEFERLCPKERDYLVLTGQCSICIVLCLHVWASNTASFFSMYHLYSCRWLLTTQLPSANRPLSMCMHPWLYAARNKARNKAHSSVKHCCPFCMSVCDRFPAHDLSCCVAQEFILYHLCIALKDVAKRTHVKYASF